METVIVGNSEDVASCVLEDNSRSDVDIVVVGNSEDVASWLEEAISSGLAEVEA